MNGHSPQIPEGMITEGEIYTRACVFRDSQGRFLKGNSGNDKGRPKGSNNRRKRADPTYVPEWHLADWRIFHKQKMCEHNGNKAHADLSCIAMWQGFNRPACPLNQCAVCNRAFPMYEGYFSNSPQEMPVNIEGINVHHRCASQFTFKRKEEAMAALREIGLRF